MTDIVAPAAGEVISPEWTAAVSTGINNIVNAVPVEAKDTSVTDGSTTSTSFTNSLTTTTTRGVVFTAPASGTVLVSGGSSGRNSVGQFTFLDFEVRSGSTIGSGTILRATDDNGSVGFQSDSTNQQGQLTFANRVVSGLTPGATYHAVLAYRVNSTGAGTYNRRWINVVPR